MPRTGPGGGAGGGGGGVAVPQSGVFFDADKHIEVVAGTNMTIDVYPEQNRLVFNAVLVGGGVTTTTVELDMGTPGVRQKRFTIADAGVGAASKVKAWPSCQLATGKQEDEAEMEVYVVRVTNPQVGSFDVIITGLEGPISGNIKVDYQVFA